MSEYVIAVLTLAQKRCWHSRSCPLQVADGNTAIKTTSRQENHIEKNNWLLFPVWVRLNLVGRQVSLLVHLDTWQLIPHDNNKVWSSESGVSPGFCCRIRFICQAMFYAGSTRLKTLGGHGRRSHYLLYISRMTVTWYWYRLVCHWCSRYVFVFEIILMRNDGFDWKSMVLSYVSLGSWGY